jgi:ABC-type lipoprotein release transport system permease subunit
VEALPAQAHFPDLEGVHFRFMNIYLRTHADPRQMEDELRERMRQFDPHVPVVGLQTMNEQIGFSLRTERLVASLSGLFGGLATLLAVIGLYGVMAYVVMRRTREIGIRSQLFGLDPRDPLTFIGSAVLLALAAGSAGFIPPCAQALWIRQPY